MFHLCKPKRYKQLAAALAAGADPNQRDSEHNTMLHYAVHWRGVKICELLLSYGAKPDQYNCWRNTPLMLAAANGLPGAVRVLLKAGADPDKRTLDGDTARTFAASASVRKVLAGTP